MNEHIPDINENTITGSINIMGIQSGLTVVAERVEEKEQLSYLAKHNAANTRLPFQ